MLQKQQSNQTRQLYYGNNHILLSNKQKELFESGDFQKFFGDINDLIKLASSSGLFVDNKKQVLISDLTSKVSLDDLLKNKGKVASLGIVFFNYASLSNINKYKSLFNKTEKYNIEDDKDIFKLLDYCFASNLKQALNLSEKFIINNQALYVHAMLFYAIKNLSYYYYDKDTFNKLHSFVKQKTINQAKKISEEKLKIILKALADLDFKLKTGAESNSLINSFIVYICKI